jgi:predicted RNA-binding Zn ribbon-like protein
MRPLAELPFVADHPALDFLNTAEERGHPQAGEALHSPADLRLWGRRYGLLEPGELEPAREARELQRALEARELLYRVLFTRVHGGDYAADDLRQLAELESEAFAAGELVPGADGSLAWGWPRTELSTVRHVAVTSALDLLRSGSGARIKQCPGDHCGWFFIDATKRGNRRWCSMGECGQEAKTARRRQRRQQG